MVGKVQRCRKCRHHDCRPTVSPRVLLCDRREVQVSLLAGNKTPCPAGKKIHWPREFVVKHQISPPAASALGTPTSAPGARSVGCVPCRRSRLVPNRSAHRLPRKRSMISGPACGRRDGQTHRRRSGGLLVLTWPTCGALSRTGRRTLTGRRTRWRWPGCPVLASALSRLQIHFVHVRGCARRAGLAHCAQPRLAGLVLAVSEGHPAAHRPGCPRRRPY